MNATKKQKTIRVLLADLPVVRVGDIVGRGEFCNAEGVVRDRWIAATPSTETRQGWGESCNNACSSAGPRALYRVIEITPPTDDAPFTSERVHGVAVLANPI